MKNKVYCLVCRGTCRLDLRERGEFDRWAKEEPAALRKFTVPEWYRLLSSVFHITGVRL